MINTLFVTRLGHLAENCRNKGKKENPKKRIS